MITHPQLLQSEVEVVDIHTGVVLEDTVGDLEPVLGHWVFGSTGSLQSGPPHGNTEHGGFQEIHTSLQYGRVSHHPSERNRYTDSKPIMRGLVKV